MKIVIHTKYGAFESKEQENTDEVYDKLREFLSNIPNYKYISIETEKGFIYMTSSMINESLFSLERN
jgi:hypothetical protein